jgi:Uma2 family endonuclease
MPVIAEPAALPMLDGLLKRLGNIPPERICLAVPPGEATERDVIRLQDRTNRNFELVEGTLVEKPVGQLESFLTLHLAGFLWFYLRNNSLGYLTGPDGGIRVRKKLVRMPDIAFISWEQLPTREPSGDKILPFAARLAVEVLSESNTPEEIKRKKKEYFRAGTHLVWIVDLEKRVVEVWTSPDESVTLTEEETLDGGAVLPGFHLALRDLFANLPRIPARRAKKAKSGRERKR